MTPENIEAIKNVLAPVADKIGQGAEYGWEVLVMGQFAEGVAMLILGSIGVTASALVVRWGKKNYVEDDMDMVAIFAMTFGSVGTLILSALVYNGLIAVISPEYAALKFLISLGS